MTDHAPHLVFVTSLVPSGRPTTGYEIANHAVIAALRRRGFRVTVVGFARPGGRIDPDGQTVVLGEIDPATHSAGPLGKFRWLVKAFASGLPIGCAKLRIISDRAFEAALEQAGPADFYVLNAVQVAGAFEHPFEGRKFCYVAHNVEFRSAAENAETANGFLMRYLYRRDARLLKEIENRLVRGADIVFTFADEDRKALGIQDKDRSAVLPLVTCDEPVRPAATRRPHCDAALIGTWTWQPNLVGLQWFLEEVIPLLPDDFTVCVAGSLPPGFAGRHPGVTFVGKVPDAWEFLRSARVVPLVSRAGTGVQLKSIETFELGLPAVATRHAVRGIAHVPENCTITDDPSRFAEALLRASRGEARDMDGAKFHRAQLAALDEAIETVLAPSGAAEAAA